VNVALALALVAQAAQVVPIENGVLAQIACAPMSLEAPPVNTMRVVGGQVQGRIMFGPGEPLVINAGTANGIKAGQMYFVRRYVVDRFTPIAPDFTPHSVHTAGWVTIVDARDNMAVATVTRACDGILEGDYLEPFAIPVAPEAAADARPDFEHPARLVMADERRQAGYPGLVMLLNRGSDHGIRPGQALTIFREAAGGAGGPVLTLGSATILRVFGQTSVIRIDTSSDVIWVGDLVAIHRITQ
jgi:hypothetical protein